MKRFTVIMFLFALISASLFPQQNAKEIGLKVINEEVIGAQLEFLSSDWMDGRETGTKGAYMASDYIASMFKEIGLEPAGDFARSTARRSRSAAPTIEPRKRTYFQNFSLLESQPVSDQKCGLVINHDGAKQIVWLDSNSQFSFSAGSNSFEIEAPLVFIGYGINDPDRGYNDFEGIDVKGKILVRLQGYPGHLDESSKGAKKFGWNDPAESFRYERLKNTWASEAGASAVIDIGSRTNSIGQVSNIPFRYNETNWEGTEPFRNTPRARLSLPESGQTDRIIQITLSKATIDRILGNASLNVQEFETKVSGSLKPSSRILPGLNMVLSGHVETRLINARNVVGMIEGKNTEQCIVLGAHYDHLGNVRGFIYNGSDDNASGTVGIMTIARAIKASGIQPEVTIIFCAWTGEEKGLIGSAYFANNPVNDKIKCYMNYDMISRVAPDDSTMMKCDYNSTSTLPMLQNLAERNIKDYNLKLDMAYKSSERPRGGSDFSSFSAKGIPIFLIHGKFTPDYHQYTDHSDKANLSYMADIVRLGYLNIFELSTTKW